jgi:hypothetical protein
MKEIEMGEILTPTGEMRNVYKILVGKYKGVWGR